MRARGVCRVLRASQLYKMRGPLLVTWSSRQRSGCSAHLLPCGFLLWFPKAFLAGPGGDFTGNQGEGGTWTRVKLMSLSLSVVAPSPEEWKKEQLL